MLIYENKIQVIVMNIFDNFICGGEEFDDGYSLDTLYLSAASSGREKKKIKKMKNENF